MSYSCQKIIAMIWIKRAIHQDVLLYRSPYFAVFTDIVVADFSDMLYRQAIPYVFFLLHSLFSLSQHDEYLLHVQQRKEKKECE